MAAAINDAVRQVEKVSKDKINQLTAEQRELIGEFRLSIIKDGLKEFPDLHPLDALQMMEEIGG